MGSTIFHNFNFFFRQSIKLVNLFCALSFAAESLPAMQRQAGTFLNGPVSSKRLSLFSIGQHFYLGTVCPYEGA